MKAVAAAVGENCEFEDKDIIKTRFGVVPGGVPPFGHLLGMETYFDAAITSQERAAFNCGMQTESIVMRSSDLVALVEPKKIGAFSKEAAATP